MKEKLVEHEMKENQEVSLQPQNEISEDELNTNKLNLLSKVNLKDTIKEAFINVKNKHKPIDDIGVQLLRKRTETILTNAYTSSTSLGIHHNKKSYQLKIDEIQRSLLDIEVHQMEEVINRRNPSRCKVPALCRHCTDIAEEHAINREYPEEYAEYRTISCAAHFGRIEPR